MGRYRGQAGRGSSKGKVLASKLAAEVSISGPARPRRPRPPRSSTATAVAPALAARAAAGWHAITRVSSGGDRPRPEGRWAVTQRSWSRRRDWNRAAGGPDLAMSWPPTAETWGGSPRSRTRTTRASTPLTWVRRGQTALGARRGSSARLQPGERVALMCRTGRARADDLGWCTKGGYRSPSDANWPPTRSATWRVTADRQDRSAHGGPEMGRWQSVLGSMPGLKKDHSSGRGRLPLPTDL